MATVSDVTARKHLVRMVSIQEAADATRDRLREAKREAQGDGLSLEAINPLLPLLSKYPRDKAAGVLKELVRYAEAYGSGPLRVTDGSVGRATVQDATVNSLQRPGEVEADSEAQGHPSDVPAMRRARSHLFLDTSILRLPTQVAMAALITFGLLWMLN